MKNAYEKGVICIQTTLENKVYLIFPQKEKFNLILNGRCRQAIPIH